MKRAKSIPQSQTTIKNGLHILARIIARETLKDHLIEVDRLNTDFSPPSVLPEETSEAKCPQPIPQRNESRCA
jgi:hypothetical protein